MDWETVFKNIGPGLISFLQNTVSGLKTNAPPAAPPPSTAPGTVPHPSAAIRDLQALLNVVLGTNLATDGWLGPKTEAAIEQGIARIKATLNIA